MASDSSKKPLTKNKQPEVDRLLNRAYVFLSGSKISAAENQSKKTKRNIIKARSGQPRDKHGRFAKKSLGIVSNSSPPKRDSRGRFASPATEKKVYRDKRGRFTGIPLAWYQRRTAKVLPVITLTIGGILALSIFLSGSVVIEEPVAVNKASALPSTAPIDTEVTVTLQESEPTHLTIEKIGVSAPFIMIGKEADGSLEVPGRPDVVGWYNKAPTPGELGPAIVVGHVDRPGGTAVFWRLRELVPGDTFEIKRADGSVAKFKVDSVKQFRQDKFPTNEVYGNIDHAGIRLITCGGVFDRQTRNYSHNTVVYGSLIN